MIAGEGPEWETPQYVKDAVFSGRAGIRRLGPCGKRRAGDEISGRNPGKGLSRPSRPFRPGDAGFPGGVEKPVGPEAPRADRGRKLRRPDFPPSLPGKAGRALLEESRDPFQEIPGFARLRLSPGFRFEGGGQVFFKAPAINRLVSARALVGAWARRPASFIVSFSRASSGTTRLTNPARKASSAERVSPSMAISRARPSPMSRGRKKEVPASGTRPILINAMQ